MVPALCPNGLITEYTPLLDADDCWLVNDGGWLLVTQISQHAPVTSCDGWLENSEGEMLIADQQ